MSDHAITAPIDGVEHQMFGGARIDVMPVGAARLKRIIYPPGHRWSANMKPLAGTDLCQHTHVGFMAQGTLVFEYPDGCTRRFTAPQAVVVEPGHDAYVEGDEEAVLLQFDFERDTTERLGVPASHTH